MSMNELPFNLNQLSYNDMLEIARGLVADGKYEAGAHVVRQMVKQWPERVRKPQDDENEQEIQGGELSE